MTRIAAQINTVRAFCQNQTDFLDTLSRLRDMGFAGVELEFSLLKNADREAVAKHLQKTGLQVASIRSPFARTGFGLEDMIDQAKTLDCRNVGIGTMTVSDFNQGPAGMDRYFGKVEEVSRRFAQEGLRPLYSLRNHEFMRQKDGLWIYDKLLSRPEASALQFETDLLCLTRAAVEPHRIFRQLAGRMPVCRITDQKIRENEMYFFFPEREECPLGEGLFDLDLWCASAMDSGAEWFVVGQDLCDRDPFACLQISLDWAGNLVRK